MTDTDRIIITCHRCRRQIDYSATPSPDEQDCCRETVAGLEQQAEDARIGAKARCTPALFDTVFGGFGRMHFTTRRWKPVDNASVRVDE